MRGACVNTAQRAHEKCAVRTPFSHSVPPVKTDRTISGRRVAGSACAACRRVPRWARFTAMALLLCFGLFALFEQYTGGRDVTSDYHARTVALRSAEITVYAPPVGYAAPRAILVFFGNDVGFWAPHRRLAFGLSRDGYAVIGVDIRTVLANLPSDPGLRADAVRQRVRDIIDAGHAEFDGPRADTPLVLAGHSLGAELALWSAASVPAPSLAGVVAMSPGSRSHLRISASDLLMTGEPQEAGSFAVSDLIKRAVRIHPNLRIAHGQRSTTVLAELCRCLRDGFGIVHITIQIEHHDFT